MTTVQAVAIAKARFGERFVRRFAAQEIITNPRLTGDNPERISTAVAIAAQKLARIAATARP